MSRYYNRYTLSFLAFLFLAGTCLFLSGRKREASGEFYWMPYCHYGINAATQLLNVTRDDDIRFYYIAIDKKSPTQAGAAAMQAGGGCSSSLIPPQADSGQNGRFYSLHGDAEVEEGIRQVAISKQWPSYWRAYLKKFVSNPQEDWTARCKAVGLSVGDLERLAKSKQAEDWFAENVRHVREKNVTLSPTLIINGKSMPHFPDDEDQLRGALCTSGVMKANCEGVLCSDVSHCKQKQGFNVACSQGNCVYTPEPVRPDAVEAYLIVPNNCMPCVVFPLDEAIKGWHSYFKVTRIDVADDRAKSILKGAQITSFPVLAVPKCVGARPWGKRCVSELQMSLGGDHFLVSLEWSQVPFAAYAQIENDDKGIRVKPDQYLCALFLHQIGMIDAAQKCYRLALNENQNDYRAWNNLGALLYDKQGLKQTGAAMFERAAALNEEYEPALENLGRYYTDAGKTHEVLSVKEKLGWRAIQDHRWNLGKTLLTDAMAEKQLEFSARKGLAYIAIQEGRPDIAVEHLNKCLAINAGVDGDFANLLAGAYFRLGNNEAAADWYLKAVNNARPCPQAYGNLCFLLSSREKWDELAAFTSECLKRDPANTDVGFYEEQALIHLERVPDAIALLNKLSSLSESARCRASYELASIYERQDDKNNAVDNVKIFLRLTSNRADAAMKEQFMRTAQIALKFKDFDTACHVLDQVVRVCPSCAEAHKLLAVCYQNLGRIDEMNEQFVLLKQFGGG